MKMQKIHLGEYTDWANKYGVYAQNRDSRMFENESYTAGMAMAIYDEDENDVANELGKFLADGRDYEYVLYDGQHRLCGFVYYDDEQDGAEPTEKRYVFRFHAHTWVDIAVRDIDEEAAMEKAQDIYNSGDYEENPENFENTDCEDITDYTDGFADNE